MALLPGYGPARLLVRSLALLLACGLGCFSGVPGARAAVPPPLSIQVYFDQQMQSNSTYFEQLGSRTIPFYVVAYDLPDSIDAVRFRFDLSDSVLTSVAMVVADLQPAAGWQNGGADDEYLLQAVDGCADGSGRVVLAVGSLFVMFLDQASIVTDLQLCLGAIVVPGGTGSGLDVRRCGDPTWIPLQLHYPGCAILNPKDLTPAPIPDNDPNWLTLELQGPVTGEPTTPIHVSMMAGKSLEKVATGDPAAIGSFHYRLRWDPAIATYQGITVNDVFGFTVQVVPQPGQLEVRLDGGSGFVGPPWLPSSTLVASIDFLLADQVGSTAMTAEILQLTDRSGLDISFTGPDSVVITSDCVPGDVIPNGEVNSLDALAVLRYVAALDVPDPREACRADVNRNGSVDAGDAVLVLRKAVGLMAARGDDGREEFPSDEHALAPPEARRKEGRVEIPLQDVTIQDLGAGRVDILLDGAAIRNPGDGRIELPLDDVAGLDLWLTFDPEQVELSGWDVGKGFAEVVNQRPGSFRLAAARAQMNAASLKLDFEGSGRVEIKELRTWNAEGKLTREVSGEIVELGDNGRDTPLVDAGHPLSCYPSPFNAETTIVFHQDVSGPAGLRIVDAHGRLVWSWKTSAGRSGLNRVLWKAVDGQGRPVASGVYRVVLEAPGGVRKVWPVTLVR